MNEQRQDDQLEPMYNSSVRIQDIALKTYWKQWTIEKGGEKESEISVLMVRDDGDDDLSVPPTREDLAQGLFFYSRD